jgi:hypothetical protein
MARDFENLNDIADLDDRELRDLVRARLSEHNGLDIDDITVQVTEGVVTLSGRVGTDGERLVAEHVLTDVIGVSEFNNELFVDPNRRAESPEAIDEHLADESRREGVLLGDRAVPLSPEVEEVEESLDAELYGTTDVHQSITDGTAWIPPESPTQEGLLGRDEMGENH